MKKIIIVFMSLILMQGLVLKAQPVVLNAMQDNTIYSNQQLNSNGSGENFTSGVTLGGNIRRALIKFDLSSIPPGSTITAVTLNLYMNQTTSSNYNFSLYPLNTSWGEGASVAGGGGAGDGNGVASAAGDATWICTFADGAGACTSLWTTLGGDFQPTASATSSVDAAGPYSWSSAQMVTDVQNWLNTPAGNHGWILRDQVESPTTTAKRFSSRSHPTIAQRPALTVDYTTVVPVTMLNFKARAQKYGSILKWETAQEFNNDFFEIEHSSDGRQFSAIGKVPGAGNSTILKSYQFIHQAIDAGRHFYRIVQSDYNGQKNYSRIESVELDTKRKELLITPNPVANKIVLPGLTISKGQYYTILSLSGQKLSEAPLLNREIALPAGMAPGIYQLRIRSADGQTSFTTFMKQ